MEEEQTETIFEQAVRLYNSGKLDLNRFSFIAQNLSDYVDEDVWKNQVFPLVVHIETINAISLDEHRHIDESEKQDIQECIEKLRLILNEHGSPQEK